MDIAYLNIGFALTGSFCTFSKVLPEIKRLTDMGAEVYPIMSEMAYSTDTRFGNAEDFRRTIEDITGRKIIHSVKDAEPIGPRHYLDAMVIAPCTGNTIAKLANGIADSCVTMAAKAHLRNAGPLVIAVSTNDGLGNAAKNIGLLMNMQNVYFVPFNQDDPLKKPKSLVADMSLVAPAVESALDRVQIQPVFYK